MKYCPTCGAEYFDDIRTCDDCESELVDESEWRRIEALRNREDHENFVKIITVENQFESDVVSDALRKESIPLLVRTFQDTAYNGIYVAQKGWGVIMVPEEFKEKAKAIANAVLASE